MNEQQLAAVKLAREALAMWITPNWAGAGVDEANAAHAALQSIIDQDALREAQPAVPLTDDLYRAIDSMIESHEAGDLDGWEVQLVKRRLREAAHGITTAPTTGETK